MKDQLSVTHFKVVCWQDDHICRLDSSQLRRKPCVSLSIGFSFFLLAASFFLFYPNSQFHFLTKITRLCSPSNHPEVRAGAATCASKLKSQEIGFQTPLSVHFYRDKQLQIRYLAVVKYIWQCNKAFFKHHKTYFAGFKSVAAAHKCWKNSFMAKLWVGIVAERFTSRFFSVYLRSLTHSVMLQTFSEPAASVLTIRPPANFDSGASQANKLTWYLFMNADTVEAPQHLPSHCKYGLIYKGMLGLSCLRQLYSIEVARAEAARKNTFPSERTIHL